jgi:hypothetical protein
MVISIEEKTVCLYQLYKHYINLSNDKHGDCRICTPDYKNKECTGYYPIKLYRMEIQNGNKNSESKQ